VFAAVLGAGLTWTAAALAAAAGLSLPRFPLAASVLLAVFAVALLVVGLLARRRLRQWKPSVAVPLLALGKTAVWVGAALFGGYVVIILHSLRLSAEFPRERFISAIIAAVAAGVLVSAGYIIQHACRIPPDDQDNSGSD
jgi:hypothetical protein